MLPVNCYRENGKANLTLCHFVTNFARQCQNASHSVTSFASMQRCDASSRGRDVRLVENNRFNTNCFSIFKIIRFVNNKKQFFLKNKNLFCGINKYHKIDSYCYYLLLFQRLHSFRIPINQRV